MVLAVALVMPDGLPNKIVLPLGEPNSNEV